MGGQETEGGARNSTGWGIGLGLALGAAFGLLMDNLALGIALGLVLGITVDASGWFRHRGRPASDESTRPDRS